MEDRGTLTPACTFAFFSFPCLSPTFPQHPLHVPHTHTPFLPSQHATPPLPPLPPCTETFPTYPSPSFPFLTPCLDDGDGGTCQAGAGLGRAGLLPCLPYPLPPFPSSPTLPLPRGRDWRTGGLERLDCLLPSTTLVGVVWTGGLWGGKYMTWQTFEKHKMT